MVDHIAISKKWAENFVVKENLCPFAKEAIDKDMIEWEVIRSVELLADRLDSFIASTYTSKFLIFSFLDSFRDFLDLADFTQHLVDVLGYSEDIKLVLFHPSNQYRETDEEDPINYANKAPFATIQLLRNKDLKGLKMTEKWKEQILDRNARYLKQIGRENLREIFDEFRK